MHSDIYLYNILIVSNLLCINTEKMKKTYSLLLLLSTFIFMECQKTEISSIPVLSTNAVSNVRFKSMTCGGNITSDGGSNITSRGIYWSKDMDLSDLDSMTIDGNGSGPFISSLRNLTPNEVYHIRAYAINIVGTGYGQQILSKAGFITGETGTLNDIDGNPYPTIVIGRQVWMAENLKTTKFNDGTTIPTARENSSWDALTTPAYCWYNNDEAKYKSDYGALYNKYASNSDKLCPTGWHVPSFEEWNEMCLFVKSYDIHENTFESVVSTGLLKEAGSKHWEGPNTGATNESGFTALPGGVRFTWPDGTAFRDINREASWWNSSPPSKIDNSYSWINLSSNNSEIGILGSFASPDKKSEGTGMSIRCIKN
jgi:uncharacterized protein (TIGR02145 family)